MRCSFGLISTIVFFAIVAECLAARGKNKLTVQQLKIIGHLHDAIITADIGNGSSTNVNVSVVNTITGGLFINAEIMSELAGKYQTLTKFEDIDFCKFITNFGKDPVLKVVFPMVRQKEFMHDCPIEKGLYTLKDISFDPNVMPFRLLPVGKFRMLVALYNKNSTYTSEPLRVDCEILMEKK